ncbi:Imm8 family immunity protein [Pyxidicoccus sp. 3LFB2]
MSSGSTFKVAGVTKLHEQWGEDAAEFLVQLHCEVVKSGEPGGEAFQVIVASPQQLSRELQRERRGEFGRGYMFMLDYDEREVVSNLQRLLDRSGSSSWQELASFVTRYFDWID